MLESTGLEEESVMKVVRERVLSRMTIGLLSYTVK